MILDPRIPGFARSAKAAFTSPDPRTAESASKSREPCGKLGGRRNESGEPSHRKESPMGGNPAWSLGLFLILALPASAAEPPQPHSGGAVPGGRVLELRVVERDGGEPV